MPTKPKVVIVLPGASRMIFHTREGGIEIECPSCHEHVFYKDGTTGHNTFAHDDDCAFLAMIRQVEHAQDN